MGYVVYNPTTRVISSAPRTQAEANTIAAADADLTADTVDRTLPNLFSPGGWFFTDTNEIVNRLPLSELEQLKAAARACHSQLLVWSQLLTEAAITHSASDAQIGHDILFHGHEGIYIVCRNDFPVDAEHPVLSIAQRITFCQQMAYGASDVTNPEEFFQHVHGVRDQDFTKPVVWVNPQAGTRIDFDTIAGSYDLHLNSYAYANDTVINLDAGSWIEDLVA